MKHYTTQQKYFSDRDIAKRFGISRNTVWRWAREGRLPPPTKIGPNCSRWPESAVDELTRGEAAA